MASTQRPLPTLPKPHAQAASAGATGEAVSSGNVTLQCIPAKLRRALHTDRPHASAPGVVPAVGGDDCGLGCRLAAGALIGLQGPPMQMADAQKAAAAGGWGWGWVERQAGSVLRRPSSCRAHLMRDLDPSVRNLLLPHLPCRLQHCVRSRHTPDPTLFWPQKAVAAPCGRRRHRGGTQAGGGDAVCAASMLVFLVLGLFITPLAGGVTVGGGGRLMSAGGGRIGGLGDGGLGDGGGGLAASTAGGRGTSAGEGGGLGTGTATGEGGCGLVGMVGAGAASHTTFWGQSHHPFFSLNCSPPAGRQQRPR